MATRTFATSLHSLRAPLIAVGLGLTATACIRQHFGLRRPLLLLDSGAAAFPGHSSSFSTYQRTDAPITKSGRLNPRVIRQISTGSIFGVLAGLGVSVFSKPLAVILGLLIVGVQVAESQLGIRLVPYNTIQRYFKGIDVRGALQENVPFKISFGLIFALTGFGAFSSGV